MERTQRHEPAVLRDQDGPAALLHARARLLGPWVLARVAALRPPVPQRILDLGCGTGLLSNPLARAGHRVTGVDPSRACLETARRQDRTGTVAYLRMDARRLAFPAGSFDVVCALGPPERAPDLGRILSEAERVLVPGGLIFLHAANRTLASRWLAGVPPWGRLTPGEVRAHCRRAHLRLEELRGVAPRLASLPFLRLLLTSRARDGLRFRFTRTLAVGFAGLARKTRPPA